MMTLCPTCGTPQLEGAEKTLVLYFPTAKDREEFIVAFKEVHPNAETYSTD